MSFQKKLDALVRRHEELGAKLSAPGAADSKDYGKWSKEYSDLAPLVESILALRGLQQELKTVEAMRNDPDCDPEIRTMADEEINALHRRLPELEHEVKLGLLPEDVDGKKNAILEIRAGTGGEEAALFAAALFRMYQRYAEIKGWKFEIMSLSETGIGGYKEATAEITGHAVFSRLKFESGVHRVQRVPATEASGRIHTSAATVAVLPEAEEVDIVINESDLKIDTYRSSGAGGQHVNTTDSAIRITHIPTGTVVAVQEERSQHKNRARAMKMLRSRIYDVERQKKDLERAADRKGQVGSGDRSERIRTYNYPQGRVTDHRINLTLYKLQQMLDGEGLDEMVDALTAEDQAERLAEVEAQ